MNLHTRLFFHFAVLGLSILLFGGCAKSHSEPCKIISTNEASALLGTPAVVRETGKLNVDRREGSLTPAVEPSEVFGFAFVHTCSIEAAATDSRDKGVAITVFFTRYVSKARANDAYSKLLAENRGETFKTRKGTAFATRNAFTNKPLSIWLFKDDISVDFSLGQLSAESGRAFAFKLSGEL